MSSSFRPSYACCTTPRIIGPPYEPKGQFVEVDGFKIYCSGLETATKALFIIYDVFGYSYQILQGADFLASQGYKVFMPDFFGENPAPMTWMPMPDASGKEPPVNDKALDDFCEGPGNTEQTVEKVLRLRQRLQADDSRIQQWGLLGYCWGGYVANFLLDLKSPFGACVELHPGFPAKEVAEKVARPILALCSKDEPKETYAHFKPHVRTEFKVVHFSNMVHGWLSARGDLYRPEVQKEYQRGYEMVAEFLTQRLA
ncbi:hypothetical protein M409DRAFT_18109 [Zasmidium cellare ATCC 36951]|uniref:Dienelactone hydrolase domain-containing protein n=1 Tax=Zasmidium cellare ATCC 36951 TaxID=1080233 RepID=A0A6A6CXD5_ZASCE|nr:uncharacterized protein M409DRAFT_18109 [Zasmidium cellare ATCC 36951]KAF2171877.1 hypothetical protein M409DRAFT_18109 [Zasmidium cellare ATCC 36951]